jgi:serine/threonine protein kinase
MNQPESLRRLGDFEIVRELGRGGMGVVYEARQLSLNRKVALKVLSGGLGLTGKAVQRFRREAEAAAKLHHTNIVPVHATGEQDGIHFYAMELIEGPSLDHVLRQLRQPGEDPSQPAHLDVTGPFVPQTDASSNSPAPLSSSSLGSGSGYFDAVARMIAEVADALDYAHTNGVIHRDIKPSNLLLSPQGRLSVNDFGLARVLEQPGLTITGEFVGTPAYTSPEQITAGRIPLDHRSDIYSLGATLYELLTLQPPFTGKQRDQVLAQIVHKEPRPPRKVNPKVPVDLETICLKALEKDPDRRYQTAGQMAEDLRRYVNRYAIAARRAGPVQQLLKWARRQPVAATSLGCLLLAVAVAFAFAYQAHRSEQQRLDQQEQARRELLDEKIRSAYQVASSGDLKKTDEAIKEIEALGASTGQVRLLRGMVAYFRDDPKAAMGELEQAVKLLPESVTALALLAVSYGDCDQNDRGLQTLLEMVKHQPSSPEDYLFRGYAHEYIHPGQGLDDLKEGLRQRDSPLGRALRSFALGNRALDRADKKDGEAALADANLARGMLPNNPLALSASLYARTVLAALYAEAKLTNQRLAVLQEAQQDIQALEPFISLSGVGWELWAFYVLTGDTARALDATRRSLEASGNPKTAWCTALQLYGEDRLPEARQCLERGRESGLLGDLLRVLIVAESPDGQRLALQEYDNLCRKYRLEGRNEHYSSVIALLLGQKELAQAALEKEGARTGGKSEATKGSRKAEEQFARGELSEDNFLAKAGNSRFKQFGARYERGISRLAVGDRKSAKEHFQKAVATRAFWVDDYQWCVAFLSRLEKDPTWPPWIPGKPLGHGLNSKGH